MVEHETALARREQIVGITILALALVLAAWLRFHDIGIKPFHHDEGVNSFFLLNLAHHGQYAYNPDNYHGPTLYYFALTAIWAFGETDLALRFWPAACGLLTIAALWWLRRDIGSLGMAAGALFMALSPGLVYFSRDFIHEISFGFFTLVIVVAVVRYAETRRFAFLATFAASLGLLFATKETAVITVTVLVLAWLCALIWSECRQQLQARSFSGSQLYGVVSRELRELAPSRDHLVSAGAIFVVVNVLFYTSFFTNMRGVVDAIQSLFLWSGRSGSEHVHSFFYYFLILFKLELPLLIGGVVGGVVVVLWGTRFGLFLAAWTLGMFLAYSSIPYKTPWLVVNVLVPLGVFAGYAAAEVYRRLSPISPRLLWGVVCLVAFILSWQMAYEINFRHFDDNDNSSGYLTRLGKRLEWKAYTDGQHGYVYAQTDRDLLNLPKAVDDAVAQLLTKQQTGIFLASTQYWPLPWYLRRYPNVAYTGALPDLNSPGAVTQPLLIGNVTQQAEILAVPGWKAVSRPIRLRPGEELILFARTP